MKIDVKIFISCLIVGMWGLNMGAVILSRSNHIVTTITGVIGMVVGGSMIVYGVIYKEDDID